MILYVAISCIAIFGAKTLYDTHESGAAIITLMTIGGIVYGIGMAFYIISKKKKLKYFHSIFHCFVLAGTFIQFFAVLKAI
jgi:hemolysin III